MAHYVIVAAGVVTEALTTPFDPNLGREKAADWTEVENEAVAPGWTTADGGKTFAPLVIEPAAPGPRTARGVLLVKALDKATKVCPRDLAYVSGLDAAREDMPSIVRIAGVDGRDPKAWFDAALGVTG